MIDPASPMVWCGLIPTHYDWPSGRITKLCSCVVARAFGRNAAISSSSPGASAWSIEPGARRERMFRWSCMSIRVVQSRPWRQTSLHQHRACRIRRDLMFLGCHQCRWVPWSKDDVFQSPDSRGWEWSKEVRKYPSSSACGEGAERT